MSFLVVAMLQGYEVRACESRTSKKGVPFVAVKLEGPDGVDVEVSTSDAGMIPDVSRLTKGDIVNWQVRAVAGKDRSYIVAHDVPVILGNAYKV